jgi:hypothetical protein
MFNRRKEATDVVEIVVLPIVDEHGKPFQESNVATAT